MGIGQRKQVQLVQRVVVQDPVTGANRQSEGMKVGVWAEVNNPSGFRSYDHGQTQLGNTKLFQIRFKFDKYPNADWKIRYEGKDWTISQLRRIDEKRFYWTMTGTSKADV